MSKRVLITGATGFAGRHLAEECARAGDAVVGLARTPAEAEFELRPVDLLDSSETAEAVRRVEPEVVFHLAALASVADSWASPEEVLAANPAMTLNVLEAVRTEASEARVLLVGTGEVYGPPETLPVEESAPLRPQNPYAVSKVASDLLGGLYADAHGLHVLRTRSFNHAGPRQTPVYVVAALARQVAAGLRDGDDPIRVVTGNPEPRRDFTDVRDVVRAYRLLVEQAPPDVYNVCSGTSAPVGELLDLLANRARVEIDRVVDPELVRSHDVMEIRGSAARLEAATGWRPEIALEQTVADTLDWWTTELSRHAA